LLKTGTTLSNAEITKVSTDTALRDLQDLMSKGIVEQEGSGRNTSYKLVVLQV